MVERLLSWQSLIDLGWLLFLVYVFAFFWFHRRMMLQARHWVKTQGRVTRCEWTTHGHSLWPKIEYVYQANEDEFKGEYFFLDTTYHDPNSAHSRNLAYQVADAYKKDEYIDVYYNPDKPEEAVLDPTMPRKLKLILGFIAALIVLHLVMVAFRILG